MISLWKNFHFALLLGAFLPALGGGSSRPPRRGKVMAVLWKLVTLPFVGVIYTTIISDGFRILIPTMGQRLYKLPIPGLSHLRHYSPVDRLDLAHLMSILLLISCWYLWTVILKVIFSAEGDYVPKNWSPAKYKGFVVPLGFLVLGTDSLLFYYAMSKQSGWAAGATFAVAPLLATAAYVGVLLFIAFVSVNLEHNQGVSK